MEQKIYSLGDLCDLAAVTPRTVRYYVQQGLLPAPGASGPGAHYDDGHLNRLRLIRKLQRGHLPLAEIRTRLSALSDHEVREIIKRPSQPPPDSALEYVRMLKARKGGTLNLSEPSPTLEAPTIRASALAAPVLNAPEMRVGDVRHSAGSSVLQAPSSEVARPEASATAAPLDRSQWERISLSPEVELHVRRPLTREHNRSVTRIIEIARQLLAEEEA